jgi:ABC-type cobalt transport system substrate-binding protein
VVVTLGYLVPHLAFIESRYGVFSGFDPVANATFSAIDRANKPWSELWSTRGSYAISALLYGAAVAGLVRRARAGEVRTALLVGWMMLSPALILAVQSYGGEGRLRVYLFSLPWSSVAAAWAFWPGLVGPSRRLRLGLASMMLALAALFPLTYLLPEKVLQVPASEVAAGEWIDAQAEPGDVLLAFTPMFPGIIGPHYDNLIGNTDVSQYAGYYDDHLQPADLVRIGSELKEGAPHRRILAVFSDRQSDYAAQHQLYEPGELAELERRVSLTPGMQRLYDRAGVRVYRLR